MIGEFVKSIAGATVKETAKETVEKGVKIIGASIATGCAIELAHSGLKFGMGVIDGAMKLGAAGIDAIHAKFSKPKTEPNADNKTGKSGK